MRGNFKPDLKKLATPMISLENLQVFVRAAELGGFSAAGRALRMSAAVVSYRIRALEEELGCQLFVRTTRRINLTEQGRVFFDKCLDVVKAVERAQASVTHGQGELRDRLRVTAPLGLGRRVVAPLAAAFHRAHPGVELRLRLSEHLLDLVQESVDVALRMARFEDSSFTMRKIADVERVLCAAPNYIARRGAPKSPNDLLSHQCLLLRYPGAQQFRWTLQVDGQLLTLPVSGSLDADDGDALTAWALGGEGIVMKPVFEVAEHLRDGRLTPVLPHCPPAPVTLAALYPARRASPGVRAFTDALVEDVRRHLRETLIGFDKQPG